MNPEAPAPNPAVPPPQAAAQPTPAEPAPAQPAAQNFTTAQLDQLVAPIALYPDPLLSQVLMASTYPLEVVEAAHWVREPANRSLTGDALTEALKNQNWDPSVMALVPFPRVLAVMADRVQWTEQLGNAFLAQQGDVMASVQRLRHAALAAGNLNATPECHCIIQTSGDQITILPSEPKLVCIPVYTRDTSTAPGGSRLIRRSFSRFRLVSSMRRGSGSASNRRSKSWFLVPSGAGVGSIGRATGLLSTTRSSAASIRIVLPSPAESGSTIRRTDAASPMPAPRSARVLAPR